jgi:translation initiation factor 2 subunit 3
MAKKSELGQPEINIGLIGHVDHGKTTLTEALSGKWTDTHSEEIKRGITIRLGYADASFYKCEKCNKYSVKDVCACGGKGILQRKVSFVDAPGHETLMATMLSGAAIMDGALLLVAANEKCPQPQTKEHLVALNIAGIKNVIVVQNKIDLVTEEQALENFNQIRKFIERTAYKDAPIIPLSALHKINIDLLIEAIQTIIPTPKRDPDAKPIMYVARSFDVNKPGSMPEKIVGGVLGGTLKQGILKLGEEIEIRPGRRTMQHNKILCLPIKSKITGLQTGGNPVEQVHPGGSIGVMTSLDPSVTASDNLVGSVVGKPGTLPDICYNLKLKTYLLERVVGAKDALVVKPLAENEVLMLNVNSASTVGVITNLRKNVATVALKLPICAELNSKVTVSRNLGNRWRLIGYGTIQK